MSEGQSLGHARCGEVPGTVPGTWLERPSGIELFDLPAVATPAVEEANVQTVLAVLPELDRVRDETVAAPRLRPLDLVPLELVLQLADSPLEVLPRRERLA